MVLAPGELTALVHLAGEDPEALITFSFAALRDDQNRPSGIFCTAIENTRRIIAERQINCLRALAARSSFAETPEAACQSAAATLEGYPRDLPFATLYLVDSSGKRAHLAGTAGLISVLLFPAFALALFGREEATMPTLAFEDEEQKEFEP